MFEGTNCFLPGLIQALLTCRKSWDHEVWKMLQGAAATKG